MTYRTDRVVYLDGSAMSSTPIPVVNKPLTTVEVPNTVAAVPASTLTTIVTYTNGSDPFFIDGWTGEGQWDGEWTLLIDNGTQDWDRTTGSRASAGHLFASPVRVPAGGIIDIKVEHYGSSTGEFKATLFGHR